MSTDPTAPAAPDAGEADGRFPPRPRHEIQAEFIDDAMRYAFDTIWSGARYVDDEGAPLFPNDPSDDYADEIRAVVAAEAAEAELRIRLDERRSFAPLVQRIAEDAARRTLERIEEVADIVKRAQVDDGDTFIAGVDDLSDEDVMHGLQNALFIVYDNVPRWDDTVVLLARVALYMQRQRDLIARAPRPQPEAVTDWTDAQVDAAFEVGRSEHVPRYLVERMLTAALRATQEGR